MTIADHLGRMIDFAIGYGIAALIRRLGGRWRVAAIVLCVAAIAGFYLREAYAHDIYTGVTGRDGQLCCGADDCFRTTWREHGEEFDFLLPLARRWITLPRERVTFLPIAGDDYSPINGDIQHYGHICYRPATEFDHRPDAVQRDHLTADGEWVVYCAFIPPGGV